MCDFRQGSYYLNKNVRKTCYIPIFNFSPSLKTTFALQTCFCFLGRLRVRKNRVLAGKTCGLVRWVAFLFGEFSKSIALLFWRKSRVEASVDVGIAASKEANRRKRRRRTPRDLRRKRKGLCRRQWRHIRLGFS